MTQNTETNATAETTAQHDVMRGNVRPDVTEIVVINSHATWGDAADYCADMLFTNVAIVEAFGSWHIVSED